MEIFYVEDKGQHHWDIMMSCYNSFMAIIHILHPEKELGLWPCLTWALPFNW